MKSQSARIERHRTKTGGRVDEQAHAVPAADFADRFDRIDHPGGFAVHHENMRDGGIRQDRRLGLLGSGRQEGLSADGGACNAGTIADLDQPFAVDPVGVIRELAPAGTRLAITASLA